MFFPLHFGEISIPDTASNNKKPGSDPELLEGVSGGFQALYERAQDSQAGYCYMSNISVQYPLHI